MLRALRNLLPRAVQANGVDPDPPGYRVFSTRYDEEVGAAELMRGAGAHTARTALHTFASDLAVERSGWTTQALKLAERVRDHRPGDLAVTLLIDHSGSMRDENIQLAAAAAQVFAKVARRAPFRFEILGFTTVAWRGDPVRHDWVVRGRPPHPGRLCALRHIVYAAFSDAGEPDLAAMFLPGLLKENVDGEALAWAATRLRAVAVGRRVLIVLSDGAPVDDCTLTHNGPTILMDHLRAVIAGIEQAGDITLHGVGINHSTRGLYQRHSRIGLFGDIGAVFMPYLAHALVDGPASDGISGD